MFDLGDTLAKTIKLFSLTNRDFGERTKGIDGSGIPWLVRVITGNVASLLAEMTTEQMRGTAEYLAELAQVAAGIAEAEEAENREPRLRLVKTGDDTGQNEGAAKPHEVSH